MAKADTEVDRDTLYNEVWTDPVTVVAPRYGLSDVGLAKICRALAIPLPSRGYWAQVKAGKVMKRVPLPPYKPPPRLIPPRLVKLPPEKAEARATARKKAAELRKEISVPPVQDEPSAQHPLVRATSKRLRQRDGWPEGTLARSAPKEVLNLSVTKGSLDRALLIADALVKALAGLGFEFSIDAERDVTWIHCTKTGTKMKFELTEHVKRSNHTITPAEERAQKRYWAQPAWDRSLGYPDIPRYDYTPTGVLTLQVGHWPSKSWRDTPKTALEARLGIVVAGVVELSQEIFTREQEEKRRREAHARAVERYEFLMARRADETAKFEQFEKDASNWERSARLHAFADAVEQEAARTGSLSAEQLEWLAWARAKADWLNPLVKVSDPVLDAPEPDNPGHYW